MFKWTRESHENVGNWCSYCCENTRPLLDYPMVTFGPTAETVKTTVHYCSSYHTITFHRIVQSFWSYHPMLQRYIAMTTLAITFSYVLRFWRFKNETKFRISNLKWNLEFLIIIFSHYVRTFYKQISVFGAKLEHLTYLQKFSYSCQKLIYYI